MTFNKTEVAAVILLGGSGTRMGLRDKALLSLGDATILDFLMPCISSQVKHITLSVNGEPEWFKVPEASVVKDGKYAGCGPLAGVLSSMNYFSAKSNTIKYVLSVPGDCPFLPSFLCESLYKALRSDKKTPSYALANKQSHWLCSLWPISCKRAIEKQLSMGCYSVKSIHKKLNSSFVQFDDPDMFFNINTPQDLQAARALVANKKFRINALRVAK